MKKFAVVLLALVAVGSLAANVLLFQRYSTRRPLMRIGSEVITRKEFQDALEYQAGKAVLNKIAYAKIVMQAAKKAGVTPTDKDVDARIAEIERVNPALLAGAKQDVVKMQQMKQDIATDLALENLRVQGVTLSDAEVAAYYKQNAKQFALPAQARTTVVVAQNAVDAATAAELLRRDVKPDTIARQPRLSVVGVGGFSPDWSRLSPKTTQQLSSAVFKLKPGGVATVPLGKEFVVVKVSKQISAGVPALGNIKERVVRNAKLQKAPTPTAMLAKLYKDAGVTFEVDRYSSYFDEIRQLSEQSPKRTADSRQ